MQGGGKEHWEVLMEAWLMDVWLSDVNVKLVY